MLVFWQDEGSESKAALAQRDQMALMSTAFVALLARTGRGNTFANTHDLCAIFTSYSPTPALTSVLFLIACARSTLFMMHNQLSMAW